MGFSRGPKIVTDGLVLYLDAANPKSYPGSGNTWSDLSGNGNDGTLVNGPSFQQNFFQFDGSNDIVNTPLVLESPVDESVTFEIIFKYNSTGNFKGLMGASSYQSSGFSVGIMGNNQLRWTYNGSNVSYEPEFTYNCSVISFGTFIFNGRNLRAYRNTSLVNSSTAGFDAIKNTSTIQIADNRQSGWGPSQIDLYCTKVYNRALSEDEIKQNYNATKSRFGL